MKCTPFPNGPRDPAEMRAAQQRRHLLALYLAACDYADRLRRALLQGASPTGYGSPLTPVEAGAAETILSAVDEYLTLMREFVNRHAPDELAAYETPQPEDNTLVWASNLFERLRQIADDMAPDRLKKYGEDQADIFEDAERLQEALLDRLAQARRLVQDIARRDSSDTD